MLFRSSLFIIAIYRFFGIIATVALAGNMVMLLALMSLLGQGVEQDARFTADGQATGDGGGQVGSCIDHSDQSATTRDRPRRALRPVRPGVTG